MLPGDAAYDGVRLAYSPLFDGQRPAAIARCARASDVQACLELARGCGLPIAARSGGHSYGGYSTPDQGLVIDLGRMSEIVVGRDGTAVIGAGARLIDVYATLASAGRCLPSGTCPSVGISGITLGGGIGVLTRLHGLTCDRLLAAHVVLADGSSRTADAGHAPDLHWALRGGGGGNFGIVTSFTFDTRPAPAELTAFSLAFPAGAVADVLGAWQEWQPRMPNELWSNCVVFSGAPPGSAVNGCFAGAPSALAPLLDDLAERAGVQPTGRVSTSMSYFDAMMFFAGCEALTVAQCHLREPGAEGDSGAADGGAGAGTLERSLLVASSRMLAAPMRDPSRVADLLSEHTGIFLLFDGLGGAVAELRPDETAFPHREALASVQVAHGLTVPEDAPSARQEVASVQMALAGIVGSGAYVNYIDPNMSDWASACYGTNLPRLRQVAERYDPDGVFSFAQNVAKS